MKKEKDTQLEFDFRSDKEIALEERKKVEENLIGKWHTIYGSIPTYTVTTYASTNVTSSSYIYTTYSNANTTTVW